MIVISIEIEAQSLYLVTYMETVKWVSFVVGTYCIGTT